MTSRRHYNDRHLSAFQRTDPWLSAVERDTDRALRSMADGDAAQAVQWLALAVRQVAAHLPAVRQVAEEIRARRVVVVGPDGKPRLILAGDDRKPLQVLRQGGEVVASLSVSGDYTGPTILTVGPERGVCAELAGGAGHGQIGLSFDHDVHVRAALSETAGPSLTLHGLDAETGIKAGCHDGKATLEVYHDEDTAAELVATDKGAATIALRTKDGRHEWKAEPGGKVTQTNTGRERPR